MQSIQTHYPSFGNDSLCIDDFFFNTLLSVESFIGDVLEELSARQYEVLHRFLFSLIAPDGLRLREIAIKCKLDPTISTLRLPLCPVEPWLRLLCFIACAGTDPSCSCDYSTAINDLSLLEKLPWVNDPVLGWNQRCRLDLLLSLDKSLRPKSLTATAPVTPSVPTPVRSSVPPVVALRLKYPNSVSTVSPLGPPVARPPILQPPVPTIVRAYE